MRRARKHDNVLTGERGKWRVARGKVRKAARLAQSAQTHARLAALLKRSDSRVRVDVDTCGNNAYFAPQSATILRFATELRVPISFRRGRRLTCASPLGLPRSQIPGEEKRK